MVHPSGHDTMTKIKKVFGLYMKRRNKSVPDKNQLAWIKEDREKHLIFERFADCPKMKQDLRDYLMTSTLHGLRYIGEGRLTWFERSFWLVSFILSVVTAGFFIMNIYDKWNQTPMIISVSPEPKYLKAIPFPAITICNVNQVKKSVAMRIKYNGTRLEKKLLEATCTVHNETALADLDSTLNADWSTFKQFLISATQPCSELLALCRWKSEKRLCEHLFNTQLTDEGLCCTFNAVHKDMMFRNPKDISDLNITFPFPAVDWTPEDGYPEDAPYDGFPWRPIGAGANLGLTLVIDSALDEYYCSTTSSGGFKVLLHNPTETPKISEFGTFLSPGFEVRMVVEPRINDAQPQLIKVPIHKRNCLFAAEKKLVYFRTYTQKNCQMECEARLQIEKCNCSQYFMPKNRTIQICSKVDSRCLFEVKTLIQDNLEENRTCDMECEDCLPGCSELTYSRDISFITLSNATLISKEIMAGHASDYFKRNMAIVHIFFEDNAFTRLTKGEIFGLTEFLSNTGGLLGLCMGFSVMSLVELIYFITLRTVCKRRKIAHVPRYPFIN